MKSRLFVPLLALCTAGLQADAPADFTAEHIPLTKVTLYSSGVAQYVHEGTVVGAGTVELLFSPAQINDVLKSLTVTDPNAKTLTVDYQSEDTLRKTLESLKVDLSAASSLYDILKAQKGAELVLFTPHQITGTLVSVDKGSADHAGAFLVSLAAADGVHVISFADVQSFRFTDAKRNEDLHTALALMLEASAQNRKKLSIKIDAQGVRKIGLSYVMEAPVWKASYRLNMGSGTAAFQAWAIIDNSTDLDWKNITLTLTTGRPVGFTQNLYAPYYTYRPELPLAIAQAAEAETFDSADAEVAYAAPHEPMAMSSRAMMKGSAYIGATKDTADEEENSSAAMNQAITGSAGEMFAFTPSKPLSLERQQSTMIPLALVSLPAEKFSVFSSIPYGRQVTPKFCISIHNTSGLKLPAGPITVFDGGDYAGDALMAFLPEGEKRLIGYGDDIELTGSRSKKDIRNIETVSISDGLITILYRQVQRSVYLIKNADKKERSVIIEHPKTSGFTLQSKTALTETTADTYRFKIQAAGNKGTELAVEEMRTYHSSQKILDMNTASYISYTSNTEMPEPVRKTFEAIIKEKEKVSSAEKTLKILQDRQSAAESEQDRVRRNLEAVGAETQQGQAFLTKLLTLETELEGLQDDIATADARVTAARQAFINFVKGVKL
ncbi:MAG: DUF4139 domain-containing protein [Treponema sp.]|uniref:DUF4139 domain-containing protein n=1 Tax=Treponema sp. TaxID=166 RepID=UPI003FA29CAE